MNEVITSEDGHVVIEMIPFIGGSLNGETRPIRIFNSGDPGNYDRIAYDETYQFDPVDRVFYL